MTKEVATTIIVDGKIKPILIINNDEGYDENGKGQTPNHDKIEIVYLESE